MELVEPIFVQDIHTTSTVEWKSSPFFTSQPNSSSQNNAQFEILNETSVRKRGLAVLVPPIERRWEYQVYEEPQVSQILGEYDDGSLLVQLDDGSEEVVSERYLE